MWVEFDELFVVGDFVAVDVVFVAEVFGLFDGEVDFFWCEAGEWEVYHVVSVGSVSECGEVVFVSEDAFFEAFWDFVFAGESFDGFEVVDLASSSVECFECVVEFVSDVDVLVCVLSVGSVVALLAVFSVLVGFFDFAAVCASAFLFGSGVTVWAFDFPCGVVAVGAVSDVDLDILDALSFVFGVGFVGEVFVSAFVLVSGFEEVSGDVWVSSDWEEGVDASSGSASHCSSFAFFVSSESASDSDGYLWSDFDIVFVVDGLEGIFVLVRVFEWVTEGVE